MASLCMPGLCDASASLSSPVSNPDSINEKTTLMRGLECSSSWARTKDPLINSRDGLMSHEDTCR